MTNCMLPRVSVKTGVVISIFCPASFPPKMNLASVLKAWKPAPARQHA